MKTIGTVVLTVFLTVGVMVGTAKAGLWDSFMTSDWQTRKHDAHYQLEAYGWDARAYEFTPLANPNVTCIFVASNESSGVGCFEKSSVAK